MTSQLAKLDQKIQSGADRVLSAPDEVLDTLYAQTTKAKAQRRQIEDELRTAKSETASETDRLKWTKEEALKAVSQLAETLTCTEPKAVQAAIKTNIERIDLRSRTEQEGKRQIQRCTGGEIHLVTERQVAGTRHADVRLPLPGDFVTLLALAV